MYNAGSRIKLLIVDDSQLIRNALMNELSKDKRFTVVGLATDPYDACDKITLFDPDVIILDINLPRMNGIDFLVRLMEQYPVPVIAISTNREYLAGAMHAGAVECVEKPTYNNDRKFESFIAELVEKIPYAHSCSKMVDTAGTGGTGETAGTGTGGTGGTAGTGIGEAGGTAGTGTSEAGGTAGTGGAGGTGGTAGTAGTAGTRGAIGDAAATIQALKKATNKVLIAIGASTGGTNAIADIVSELPAWLPGIVVVQHMPPEFTGMYAQRLDSISAMHVEEAKSGDRILPGTVLIAPGNMQLKVVKNGESYSVSVQPGEKVSGHCPSVDVLFSSVAASAGPRAIGALLTGMGQDGANGLLEMKKAGAITIGQDEQSCVVYGMPKAAFDRGAVDYQLPLGQIASRIVSLL